MIINPFDNEQEFTSSDKLITHLTQLAVDKNNVFRGYGKQSELFPNIIREKDWREQEIRLLHEFERYGLQYFPRTTLLTSCHMRSIMAYRQDFWILHTILLSLCTFLCLHLRAQTIPTKKTEYIIICVTAL